MLFPVGKLLLWLSFAVDSTLGHLADMRSLKIECAIKAPLRMTIEIATLKSLANTRCSSGELLRH